MWETKLYLRCLRRNSVASWGLAILLLGLVMLIAALAMKDDTFMVFVWLAHVAVGLLLFIGSGAGLNTFYHYAVTAAAIGNGIAPINLSPNLKPNERAGAVLACYDLGCPYTA